MRFPQVSERVKEAPAHALRAVFASIGQVLLVTDRMKNKPAAEERATTTHSGEPATADTSATEATEATEATAATAAAPAAEGTAVAGSVPAADAAPTTAPANDTAPAAGKPAAKATPAEAPPAAKPATARGSQTGNVRLLPGTPAAEPDTPAAEEAAPAAPVPVAHEAAPAAAAQTAVPEAPAPTAPSPATPAAAEPAAAAEGAPPIANYEQLTIASLRARLRGLTVIQVRELIGYEQAHANRPDVIAMFERRVAKLEASGEG